jgi:hypothetical protein
VSTSSSRLHLAHPRDLSELFRDSLAVYWRHFGSFVAIGAAVVVPVQLVVGGLGQEQLTAAYDPSPTLQDTLIPTLVSFLVVAPLISAICIYGLLNVAEGGQLKTRAALIAGFEMFTPLFVAVALATAGTAVGLLLVVPGIYLFVRWYFVPQAVVLEDHRSVAALRRSNQVTVGFWWRTFGLVLAANLAVLVLSLVVTTPFAAIAESSDRAVWSLAGAALTESVTAPFVAIFSTLLFFDLRARRS